MFVIRVAPTKEQDVRKLLIDKGYNVLCPKRIKLEKRKEFINEKEVVIFSGYLFLDMKKITVKDYYNIKNVVYVIGFLNKKYPLNEEETSYIRFLNNNDTAFEKITLYFDKNSKVVIVNENECINSKNIVRVNKRNKTITFKIMLQDTYKNISFNYKEIA